MLLALDLATTTGWCAGAGDCLPTVGHIPLPSVQDGDRGPKFSMFRRWLIDQLAEIAPSVVIYEKPILPKPFLKQGRLINPTNINVTLVLQGLAAIVELECCDADVACREVDVQTVKRELAGTGKAEKPDMVRAAEKVGLKIAVHDEADAFGVWLVGVRYHARAYSQEWDRRLWSSRGALV